MCEMEDLVDVTTQDDAAKGKRHFLCVLSKDSCPDHACTGDFWRPFEEAKDGH